MQRCDWCSSEVPRSEICEDARGVGICKRCQEDASQCENCGRWTEDYCENDYCPRCHDELCHSDLIHEYHSAHHHSRHFLPDKQQDLYLGIELEMEADGDAYKVAEALYPLSNDEAIFSMEEDGSLDDGLEVISEPATLAYHKTQFGWEKILSTARELGAVSHKSNNCGLHIHFNISFFDHTEAAIDLNSAKLLYFFERFWEPMVKFSRRTDSQLSHYACRYGNIRGTTPKQVCDYAKNCGRNYAVNLGNDKTIEIRMFRGTLNEETFFACLELVDFLARYVKKRGIHYIQRTTWAKVIKAIKAKDYPNLIKYLERRELLSVS